MDRCALALPGEDPDSPTKGLVVLEMDDVMEGGDEQHGTIMTDIASNINFGNIKEVRRIEEGVQLNGRRWFQDGKRWDITFQVTAYIKIRLGPVSLVKTKKRRWANPS